jgi:hypothetical protein
MSYKTISSSILSLASKQDLTTRRSTSYTHLHGAMSTPVKVYAIVKYATSTSSRPQYTVQLDTGNQPASTLVASSPTSVSVQFITIHDPTHYITVEAWSFDATTAHDIARKDRDLYFNKAAGHGYKGVSKECSLVEGVMRYWTVLEEAEKSAEEKKTCASSLEDNEKETCASSLEDNEKENEKQGEDQLAKRKVWFWWDVVEVVEE